MQKPRLTFSNDGKIKHGMENRLEKSKQVVVLVDYKFSKFVTKIMVTKMFGLNTS